MSKMEDTTKETKNLGIDFTVEPVPCSTMPLKYDDSLCIGCNRPGALNRLVIGLAVFFQIVIICEIRYLDPRYRPIVLIDGTIFGDLGINQRIQADPSVLGIQNIVPFFCYQIAVFVQGKLSGTGVFGIRLSCLVGKFNGEEAVSGKCQVVGIIGNSERSLGIIRVVLSDLHSGVLDTDLLGIAHACRLILNLDRQHIIKGLAGRAFLFISDGGRIGQIVGHDVHSVLFIYHTGVCGI